MITSVPSIFFYDSLYNNRAKFKITVTILNLTLFGLVLFRNLKLYGTYSLYSARYVPYSNLSGEMNVPEEMTCPFLFVYRGNVTFNKPKYSIERVT